MSSTIILAFQSIATALGWTIVHSLWQITLIGLILKILLKWMVKLDATIRYALAISALVLATFWSIHTFKTTFPTHQLVDQTAITVTNETISLSAVISEGTVFSLNAYLKNFGQQLRVQVAPLMPFLAIFWIIGLLFFASRILAGLFQLHDFSTRGTQLLPNSWDSRLLYLKQISGIARPIEIRISKLVDSPITYRFFRPIILLPISCYTHLSAEQIEVILLHELAHIKRQDYLVNLLQSCIEMLFFYHPFIWWISKQVRLEREYCCDDRVMNLRHNPMLYAQTLTQIQAQHFSLKTKLAMSATGNTGDFSKRIYRLFHQKEPYARLRNSIAALLLLLLSGGMMAFYPKQSAFFKQPEVITPSAQDTIPKSLIIDNDERGNQKLPLANSLRSELLLLEKELHSNLNLLNEEKNKAESNEKERQSLQEKAIKLKKALHLKTQALKELTDKERNTSIARKSANKELFTIETFSGKKPIIYLDNKIYHKWKIDEGGKLTLDIPTEEIHAVNVFKREKAIALFGPRASGGVIYINTKSNPNSDVVLKEKEQELHLKSTDKKPLIVVDGKVSKQAVEAMNRDDIGTMNILKREAAIKKYGEDGKDGVVEIYTKGNELAENPAKADKRIKLNRAIGTPKTEKHQNEWIDTLDKQNTTHPLFIVDGKKLPRKTTSEVTLEDIAADDIASINVLKGAKALEKYGAEGTNGVVEIITKKWLEISAKKEKIKKKEKKARQKAQKKEIKNNKPLLTNKALKSPTPGLSVFPNPTRRLTNIQLYLTQRGKVKVDILNVNGQVVLQLVNDTLNKGEHQFQWNSDNQPAGSYFVHYNLDGVLVTKQVVVKR